MKSLLILAAITALAVARPESYRETEDFNFSRSSTDEGTKSGFYGAQRGNMGGNYERAHNMDTVAQNQMSGLVKQVEGDLGDGANMRTGSVYTAANSRGIYGSGSRDLSNLAGRNFAEGTYYDNSQSRLSSHNSAAYMNSHSQSSGGLSYASRQNSDAALTHSDDLQSLDSLQTSNQHNYGRQTSYRKGYQSQSGYQAHSEYDSTHDNTNSGYGSNVQTRLIHATPVRIIIRPGTRVAVPVAAQTYDETHASSVLNQNALTEVLHDNYDQGSVNTPSNAKHYESSYNYRKNWEKHDTLPSTVPVVTPTVSGIPQNSELFEDSDASRNHYSAQGTASQSLYTNGGSRRYYTGIKGSSGQSQYDSAANYNANIQNGYNTRSRQDVSSDYSNAQAQYNADSRYRAVSADSTLNANSGNYAGSQSNLNSQVENLNTKPRSYQSSYSYHKSWERQGDPYVIKPSTNGLYETQSSQRLTSHTKNQGYTGQQTYYGHGQDCDENGHVRVARSYNTDDSYVQQSLTNDDFQDFQQSQNENIDWDQNVNAENADLSNDKYEQQNDEQHSQNKWDRLEDFNQDTQDVLDTQHIENHDNIGHTDDKDVYDDATDKPNYEEQNSDKIENNFGQSEYQLPVYKKYDDNPSQKPFNLDQVLVEGNKYGNNYNEDDAEQQSTINNFTPQWEQSNDNLEQVHQSFNKDPSSHHIQGPNTGFKDNIQFGQNHDTNSFDASTSSSGSSLSSLWDKFENIEKQSKLFITEDSRINSSQHIQSLQANTTESTFNSTDLNESPIIPANIINHDNLLSNLNKLKKFQSNIQPVSPRTYEVSETTNKQSVEDVNSENVNDIGRGDIGPQILPTNLNVTNNNSSHQKPMNQDKNLEQQTLVNFEQVNDFGQQHTNLEQQNLQNSQQLYAHDFGQDNKNFEQHNFGQVNDHELGHDNINFMQHNFEQVNDHDFGQDNKNFEQHNFGQVNDHDLGHDNINFMQHNFEQVNDHDFGRDNKNFEQQNFEQVTAQNFKHDSQYLESQSFAQVNDHDHRQDDINVQNVEQMNSHDSKLHIEQFNIAPVNNHDVEKDNKNLQQNNFEHFERVNADNSRQQHNNVEQQNFSQVNDQGIRQDNKNLQHNNYQNIEQVNAHSYGQQHKNVMQQNLHNIEQAHDVRQSTENLEQQNTQNIEQVNTHHYGDSNESLEQQRFEQVNEHDFGQQNSEQINLQNFEQSNAHDQPQHTENLEEQNLELFDQGNVNNFRQHNENLQHQNLQNVVQVSTYDFGQQNKKISLQSMVQPNMQYFGHKYGNFNQQVFDFGQHNKNLEPNQYRNPEVQNYKSSEQAVVNEFEQSTESKKFQHNENIMPQNFGRLEANDNEHVSTILEPKQQNNLVQQNMQNFQGSDLTIHNFERHHADLGQHTIPGLGQQNMQHFDIEQHNRNIKLQNPRDFTNQSNSELIIQSTTVKPSIWTVVGSKFSSAKNQVFSWFSN